MAKKKKTSRTTAAKKKPRKKSVAKKKSATKKKVTRKKSVSAKKAARKKSKKKTTKRKPAKKKTARKPAKKKARKTTKKASKPRLTVAALAKRVDELESELKELRPRRRRGLSASATKTLKFTKEDGSPDLTRLTVEGTEVIGHYETEGEYTAAAGTPLSACMEISGNPGDKATISVTNARNEKLVLEMPNGKYSTIGTYTIWVKD